MKHDVFMNETTKRIFTKRRNSVFADNKCISLSLCASWVSENDRESALMKKFSLWKRWLNFIFTWRIVSLREWSWINNNDSQSLIFLFWKSVSSSWWKMKILSTSQLSIFLFFESINQSIVDLLARVFDISSIVDFFVLKVSQSINSQSSFCLSTLTISTIIIFWFKRWDIALLKREIEVTHINNLTSNSQNNIQNFKQKNLSYALFRFVCSSESASMISMSSLQRLVNLLQWNSIVSEFVTAVSMSSLQRHQKRMRSILYISAVNIKRWIYYIQAIREQMTWKAEEQQSMWVCHVINSARLLHRSLFVCLFVVNTSYFEYLQSIRTRRLIRIRKAQIRKVWNSIRSRNRYRFVASASVSAFALFWDIDRFIILICKYLREQDSQQDSHSRRRINLSFFFSHIFCFRIYLFTSIVFVLKLFASIVIKLISESQSTNFFAMSIKRRSDLFASKRIISRAWLDCVIID